MHLALIVVLLLAQEDPLSGKRLEALRTLEKLREKVQGEPRAELLYRSAMLLEEEAASKGTPELAEPYRRQARELLQTLVDESPTSPRAADARARLKVPVKQPSGALLSLDEVMHAARVDYEQEAPLAVPAGMNVSLTCCLQTNVLGDPVGVAITLLLPPFPNREPSARPPPSAAIRCRSGVRRRCCVARTSRSSGARRSRRRPRPSAP